MDFKTAVSYADFVSTFLVKGGIGVLPEERFRHDDQGFQPKGWMNQVQGFQVFPQLPVNHVVAAFQPGKGRHVVAGRGSRPGRVVEVDQDVVIGDQFMQRRQDVPVSLGIKFCKQ